MKQLLREIDEAVVRIRFAEGLRRGWEAARAEASVQLAHFEAQQGGARTDLSELRLATLGRSADDPALLTALDYWKAHRLVQKGWAPLNTKTPMRVVEAPLPRMLSQIHKTLTARLHADGRIASSDVAILKDPSALAAIRAVLDSPLPAPLRAGMLIWLAKQRPAFASHSSEVARVLARHHLVQTGFEPTGTLLTSRTIDAAALASLGNPDPSTWLHAYAQAMASALDPTLRMIQSVQAGILPSE